MNKKSQCISVDIVVDIMQKKYFFVHEHSILNTFNGREKNVCSMISIVFQLVN